MSLSCSLQTDFGVMMMMTVKKMTIDQTGDTGQTNAWMGDWQANCSPSYNDWGTLLAECGGWYWEGCFLPPCTKNVDDIKCLLSIPILPTTQPAKKLHPKIIDFICIFLSRSVFCAVFKTWLLPLLSPMLWINTNVMMFAYSQSKIWSPNIYFWCCA